jgi:hypothetical protein
VERDREDVRGWLKAHGYYDKGGSVRRSEHVACDEENNW